MGWIIPAGLAVVGALWGLDMVGDRTSYVLGGIVVAIPFIAGVSDWEGRSKDTNERLVALSSDIAEMKARLESLEHQLSRLVRQRDGGYP